MTTITSNHLFLLLLGAALLSSAVTLLVVFVVFHFWIGPRLERRIDQRLKRGAEELEERMRRRFLDMLGGKSGEVIRERARDLARTGMGILSGRRPVRDQYDDEDDY